MCYLLIQVIFLVSLYLYSAGFVFILNYFVPLTNKLIRKLSKAAEITSISVARSISETLYHLGYVITLSSITACTCKTSINHGKHLIQMIIDGNRKVLLNLHNAVNPVV